MDTDEDTKTVLYKTGLSSWMKTNFERLNTATNFETYGSSPPEAESYFTTRFNKKKLDKISTEGNKTVLSEHKCITEFPLNIHSNQANQISPHLLVPQVSNLMFENLTDDTSSSTDTTPFVTPQSSPMILRRNIIDNSHVVPKDIMACNPKKIFYKNYFSDSDTKQMDKAKKSNKLKSGKKCNVSNFDINAISPTSW